MKTQLSIKKLEYLIAKAKEAKKLDNSLSNTIEIYCIEEASGHLSDDHVAVWIKSSYAECDGELLYNHWLPITTVNN